MKRKRILPFCLLITLATLTVLALGPDPGEAGQVGPTYKVLAPISRGNLTIFPVVTDRTHDTHNFLTLDEGVRSGEVVVNEAGSVRPLVRRRDLYIPGDGAEVNRLVLVNNSDRPLILLAGEIVTGGKQDRVVGKDRIVPPKSDPIDLTVFCVEPGRWVAAKKISVPFIPRWRSPACGAAPWPTRTSKRYGRRSIPARAPWPRKPVPWLPARWAALRPTRALWRMMRSSNALMMSPSRLNNPTWG